MIKSNGPWADSDRPKKKIIRRQMIQTAAKMTRPKVELVILDLADLALSWLPPEVMNSTAPQMR